jgi:hypothetical protein
MSASTNLTSSRFDIAVWSSGPNGTNELGEGDDIVLSPEDVDRIAGPREPGG